MPAPSLTLAHGGTALLMTAERIRRRRDGLDTGEFEFDSDVQFEPTLAPGAVMPGYAGMQILESEPETDGGSYTHRVSAIGIAGSKSSRMISQRPVINLEGFDTCAQVWLTNNKNLIAQGSRMSGYGSMVCMSAEPASMEVAGWYMLTANFMGLMTSKNVKREVSSNVEIISSDSLAVTLSGGWTSQEKSQVCWPKVTVTFRYWTTYTPSKYMPVQGGSAPAALPGVIQYNLSSSEQLTYHWPNGWRLVSFNPVAISGTTITETVEVWEWQQRITF